MTIVSDAANEIDPDSIAATTSAIKNALFDAAIFEVYYWIVFVMELRRSLFMLIHVHQRI